MSTLFRRKPPVVIDSPEPEPESVAEAAARTRNYTPSKRELGVVTPKRGSANARRIGAPPMDKKEAAALRRKQGNERRAAMMNDEDWALYDRDLGPERRIARDVVDSRRNVAEYALYAVFLFMIISVFAGRSVGAILLTYLLLIIVAIAVAIDSAILTRKVKRTVAEMIPDGSTYRLGRYAVMRSIGFRRGRVPKPQVERGQEIRPVRTQVDRPSR